MKTFKARILAADHCFFEGECESLIIPTSEGLYGIMAHHTNMVAAVVPGKLVYRKKGSENEIASVSSGLVKVEDNEVLVLVDSAERPDEIDLNRALRAEAKAREELLQKRSMREYYSAQAHLARALSRLSVKKNNNLNNK